MEKCKKKWKNHENSSDIDEKGRNMINEENTIFSIFSEKYGKMSKKVKNAEHGKIFMKKVKIDARWKNYIFGFLSEK